MGWKNERKLPGQKKVCVNNGQLSLQKPPHEANTKKSERWLEIGIRDPDFLSSKNPDSPDRKSEPISNPQCDTIDTSFNHRTGWTTFPQLYKYIKSYFW